MFFNLRFNSDGCTNKNIVNLGGVSFNEASPLFNGDKCATFEPYDEDAGLYINDSSVYSTLSTASEFTIYFKYKIDPNMIKGKSLFPILSYRDPSKYFTYSLLEITDGEYFSFYMNKYDYYTSQRIPWTFDNEWHTFTLNKKYASIYIFIDGYLQGDPYDLSDEDTFMEIGEQIFIGINTDMYNTIHNFSGCIDDFCISDHAVYDGSFVPPNMYFHGEDIIDNYLNNDLSNLDLDPELEREIQIQIHGDDYYINQFQRDYLPRKCRVYWKQVDAYWHNQEFIPTMIHGRTYTTVEISGLEMEKAFYEIDNNFIEGNMQSLYQQKVLHQICMVFVDRKFIPLSKLYLIRSDRYTTILIEDRNPDITEPIKTFEIVTIPFNCIYEENQGIRSDILPLYSFTKDGRFVTSGADIYYYIDKDNAPLNKDGECCIVNLPTRSQEYISQGDSYANYVWRYGNFEVSRIDGTSAYMYFMAWDHGYITPTDSVIIYKNGKIIDPSNYRIVGYDLIEFYNYINLNFNSSDMITMQILSNAGDGKYLNLNTSKVKFAYLTATDTNQIEYTLPIITDNDGYVYRRFLVFRNGKYLKDYDAYYVNEEKNILTFNNAVIGTINNGETFLLVYFKTELGSLQGPLHSKPIYYEVTTQTVSDGTNTKDIINLPTVKNFTFSNANMMMFINGVLEPPQHYMIKDGVLTFIDTARKANGTTALLVCLKMVDELEDPLDTFNKTKIIDYEQGKRFVLYDLEIDKKQKLTIDNFICFDQDGLYISDLRGKVFNYNIIKYLQTTDPIHRIPTYLTCIYFNDSIQNKAISIIPMNDPLIKECIIKRKMFFKFGYDYDSFMRNFNYRHDESLQYGENLQNALVYLAEYNINLLDKYFEKESTCDREEFDPNIMNSLLVYNNGYYEMELRREWKPTHYHSDEFNQSYREFVMFFVNGKFSLWNKDVTYTGNIIKIKVPSMFNSTDKIEMIRFYRLNNYLSKTDNIAIKRDNNEVTRTFPARLITGEEYNTDILSTITIYRTSCCCFWAKINVVNDYKSTKGKYIKDIKSKIIVPITVNTDISAKITVSDVRDGIPDPGPSDPNSSKIYYEIYSKIYAVYVYKTEFDCSIDVPLVKI